MADGVASIAGESGWKCSLDVGGDRGEGRRVLFIAVGDGEPGGSGRRELPWKLSRRSAADCRSRAEGNSGDGGSIIDGEVGRNGGGDGVVCVVILAGWLELKRSLGAV